jgi:hypothetical protein
MRWPFRKRTADADSATTEPVAAERPQAREWTALSPLPGTFSDKAPLVIGPAPVLPPLPGRREPISASDPELRGSVQGIAAVIKPVQFDRSAAAVVHRPPRRRAVVLPQAPEPEPLTYVDEQHVEEPREPRVPHRAPAWLRYSPPPWAMPQNEEPGIPDLPLPMPIVETPPPPVPVVRPKPERRASLAQSRRLGLGAPISPADRQAIEEEPAPEEPAPAVVTPVVSQVAAPVFDEQPPLIHESVPAELAASMRQTHNVDVADVPVVRGKAVSAEARSHGARAFTRGGKVHLPDEAGPVTSPKARGLIAHELVHAVQQRTLGLGLPSPSSEHGQALEAEAVAVERFYAGESSAPAPQPLIHSPRVTPMPSAAGSYTQLDPISTPATTPTSSEHQQVIDARVREEVDRVATDTARRVVQQEWTNPSLTAQQRRALGLPTQQQQQQQQDQQQQDQPDPTAGYLEAAVLSRLRPSAARHVPPPPPGAHPTTQTQQGPLSQTTATAVQPQSTQGTGTPQQQQQLQDQQPEPDPAAGYLEAAVLGRLTRHGQHLHRTTEQHDQPQQASQTQAQSQSHGATASPTTAHSVEHAATTGAAPAHHHVDINDLDLEELSARLYSRLRSRLRMELLVDRERSGQLTDYR